VILCRKDVARNPAHVGAKLGESFNENCRLNRHVQAAHDLHSGQWFFRSITGAHSHKAGHFLFSEPYFFTAELGERKILYLEGLASSLTGFVKSVSAFDSRCHI
jgi:hypothetical protein